ncbi:uncharacterized protein N7500_010311 [Penicillium coprophilum]|uniref:uncharacterized protein n=1 Tax=Penicillium coprophilum TaxID=36646 RepID=UPI0023998A25|nr:uncharacterized protein N7500_010311 [Penicillium coprophilum]KAJ5154872.1 hypothetical protein N7500_010311 [Penicillium coprophilum]
MSTYKRKRDRFATGIYTGQYPNIEQWLENTMANIDEPEATKELTMPEKRPCSLEPWPDMDKGLADRDEIQNRISNLKEKVHGQEGRLKKIELQEDIFHQKITNLEGQLSTQDFFQQHSRLKEKFTMHERLLEIADQQINTQQELIKHLLEVQASAARQIALITQKLSQQPEQWAQQPQGESAEGQQSHPGGVNKSTDASDYILVSEDEVAN